MPDTCFIKGVFRWHFKRQQKFWLKMQKQKRKLTRQRSRFFTRPGAVTGLVRVESHSKAPRVFCPLFTHSICSGLFRLGGLRLLLVKVLWLTCRRSLALRNDILILTQQRFCVSLLVQQ